MAWPYIPSVSRCIADVAAAGFGSVDFGDVSEERTQKVRARTEKHKKPNAKLQDLYDTVAEGFERFDVGRVGFV